MDRFMHLIVIYSLIVIGQGILSCLHQFLERARLPLSGKFALGVNRK